MKIVILSPHRDDAAFSCGVLLTVCAAGGLHATIANLFTRSQYAPFVASNDLEAVTRLRKEEDHAMLRHVTDAPAFAESAVRGRVELLDFHFFDAPLRLRIATERVVEAPLDASGFMRERDKVAEALRQLPSEALVLAPLALGGHVDHEVVRAAALAVVPPLRLGFYEDLPYACRMAGEDRTTMSRLGLPGSTPPNAATAAQENKGTGSKFFSRHCLRRPNGARLKEELAWLYRSQISLETAQEMAAYASALDDGERLWLSWEAATTLRATLPLWATLAAE